MWIPRALEPSLARAVKDSLVVVVTGAPPERQDWLCCCANPYPLEAGVKALPLAAARELID